MATATQSKASKSDTGTDAQRASRPSATATGEKRPEVLAAELEGSPTAPFTPQVAVSETRADPKTEKKLADIADKLDEIREESGQAGNQAVASAAKRAARELRLYA